MVVKMLIFDFQKAERAFFKKNKLDDFDIDFFDESLNAQTVEHLSPEILKDTMVVSVFIHSEIDERVLNKFKNLQIIATRSTGYNHINLEHCCHRNIKVLNVSNYGETSVVQYAFGLILILTRHILKAYDDMHDFKFDYQKYVGRELNALTLGVAGTGAIGSGMCKIAHAFSMKILAYDFHKQKNLIDNYNVEYVDKDTLLKKSDIVSLHLPYNQATQHFINKKEFALMKSDAFLINTSRGELINTEALFSAIENKIIAGAALDVVECEDIGFATSQVAEKSINIEPECAAKILLIRRLIQKNNIIVTPHVAYDTQDAIDRILSATFNSIKDCFKGEHTNQVN